MAVWTQATFACARHLIAATRRQGARRRRDSPRTDGAIARWKSRKQPSVPSLTVWYHPQEVGKQAKLHQRGSQKRRGTKTKQKGRRRGTHLRLHPLDAKKKSQIRQIVGFDPIYSEAVYLKTVLMEEKSGVLGRPAQGESP